MATGSFCLCCESTCMVRCVRSGVPPCIAGGLPRGCEVICLGLLHEKLAGFKFRLEKLISRKLEITLDDAETLFKKYRALGLSLNSLKVKLMMTTNVRGRLPMAAWRKTC